MTPQAQVCGLFSILLDIFRILWSAVMENLCMLCYPHHYHGASSSSLYVLLFCKIKS